MKAILPILLILFCRSANATVIECTAKGKPSLFTNAEFCPPGTRFKQARAGGNLSIYTPTDTPRPTQQVAPSTPAATASPRTMETVSPVRSCEWLRQWRDYYSRQLDSNGVVTEREPGLLQKLRDVQGQMTSQQCRI